MAEIEITILGTTAGIPTRERTHPAIYLSYRGGKEFCFLFDCGEGTQRQLLLANLNLMKINDIFITHWHGDHYLGLPGLVDTMSFEERVRPLSIYAPESKKILNLLDCGYSSREFEIVIRDVPAEGERIADLLEREEFKIVSIPVEHGVSAVAYALVEKDKVRIDKKKAKKIGLPAQGQIYREIKGKGRVVFKGREIKLEDISLTRKGKKIVYSGDTRVCDNLIKLAKNADLLIQDCTYFDSKEFEEYEHASIKDLMEMMEKIKVKKVILTHISRRYRNPEELEEKIKAYPNWKIAEDFMRITV